MATYLSRIFFHLGESYPEMCASVDLLSKYFLQKMINGERKSVLLKILIVHVTTAGGEMNKIYMHLWHLCLVRVNVLLEILVTVRN